MDNQDNPNCPINHMPNSEFFSPYKESPYKISQQGKDYKHLFQMSPYPSNIGMNFTPSKKYDFGSGLYPSLGETPLPLNINIPFSPLNNNRIYVSNQKTQGLQRVQSFNGYSTFKTFYSPNNNQRISDKK